MQSRSDDSRLMQAQLKSIDGGMDNDHICMNEEVPGWSGTTGKGSLRLRVFEYIYKTYPRLGKINL